MITRIDDCKIIYLNRIARPEGNLTPVERANGFPFDIARIYYLYDVPGGTDRGGHAHRVLEQVIISVMGSFDVIIDDGWQRKVHNLNRAHYGLYVPKLIWRELTNFSSGSVCLVLASLRYDENDYLRNYEEFLRYKENDRTIS